MADIPAEVAKNCVQKLVEQVIKEAGYLCCFSSYVEKFNQKMEVIDGRLKDVKIEIEQASGIWRVTNEARQWASEAESLIKVDIRTEKCFNGLCINCWRQYRKAKDLEKKTLQIEGLFAKREFNIVTGQADLPGIKYYLSHFIHFESRESIFQDLNKALEVEGRNIIGLHGMRGTGKTSMAIKVGAKLEGSRFDKVVLLVVSKSPNFKAIRSEIARHLHLKLEEVKEEHSEKIWSKIIDMNDKLLIILDDACMGGV